MKRHVIWLNFALLARRIQEEGGSWDDLMLQYAYNDVRIQIGLDELVLIGPQSRQVWVKPSPEALDRYILPLQEMCKSELETLLINGGPRHRPVAYKLLEDRSVMIEYADYTKELRRPGTRGYIAAYRKSAA